VTAAGSALSVAFVQRGELRCLTPLPPRLPKRALRAAQFRAVSAGLLPNDAPTTGLVEPVGRPRTIGAGTGFATSALQLVVSANGSTYSRELDATALAPWTESAAAALAADGRLETGVPYRTTIWCTGPGPWPTFDLPAFAVQGAVEAENGRALHPYVDNADDMPVRMRHRAFQASLAHCREAPDVERGGVFLGHLSRLASGGLVVQAMHYCPAEHVESTPCGMHWTRGTWEAIHARRRELGPALQVVSWAHSHPRSVVGDDADANVLFLSREDVALISAHFDPPNVTSIVIDPEADEDSGPACAVFGWDRAGIGLVHRSIDLV